MDHFINMVEAQSKLAELVGRVKDSGQHYILRRHDQPVAVLIGMEEYQRLQAGAAGSPLSPTLRRRQEALVAEVSRLEARLGDPVEGLAALLSRLPSDEDPFWAAAQEVR